MNIRSSTIAPTRMLEKKMHSVSRNFVTKCANKRDFDLYTFNTWLFAEERRGKLDTELATVLSSISVACKQIAAVVGRAGISSLTGVAGTGENVQGEEQKKLDVISNDIFSMCLRNCGRTGVIASEEEENPIGVEETTSGNYIVVFDPLDGSSNIDAGTYPCHVSLLPTHLCIRDKCWLDFWCIRTRRRVHCRYGRP